jgi:hypothetical protein
MESAALEAEIGGPLTWHELPAKKSSYISLYLKDSDPSDRAAWPDQHRWLHDKLEAFYHAFAPRIKALDAAL